MCPQLLYTQSSSLFPPLPLLPLFLPLSLHRFVRHHPLLSSCSPFTSYFSSPPHFLPRHHHRLPYPLMLHQPPLDLPQLNPISPYLHLLIIPPLKLQSPSLPPPPYISRPVHPPPSLSPTKRIRHILLRR